MVKYRYSKWDDSRKSFDPDEEVLMDEISHELMSSTSVTDCLQQIQQQGLENIHGERLPGIDELLEHLNHEKQKQQLLAADAVKECSQDDADGEQDECHSGDDSGCQDDPDPANGTDPTEIIRKIDQLEKQFEFSRDASLECVDKQLLKEIMGDDAADRLEQLSRISERLDKAGYITKSKGCFQLTPRGMRRIGQKALTDVFAQLRKNKAGGQHTALKGSGGPVGEETKKYAAGDDFQIDLPKTMMNAVYRDPSSLPVTLKPGDFEVHQRQGLEQSATVLMLDLSFSMPARGHFEAAKRVAIALDGLITSQYPKDRLYIVGFSNHARQIEKRDLSTIDWGESDNYTNMQHGLFLSRKLLNRERQANKQIIMVTDGEPTAHFEDETRFFYQVPPSSRTLELTLQEVRNCTKQGITINTFMLENDPSLTAFVTKMARINKGRVFFTSADTLGQYLIVDYIANKKRTIGSRQL